MTSAALGAVLAGGRGSRLGGRKATAEVLGRPLLDWTLDALRGAVDEVVVIAKVATPLPPTDAPVWRSEPPDFHPRHGLVSALRGARGRPVVVVPVDMPLVPVALVETLLGIVEDGAPAAIPQSGGRIHPLCAAYHPVALGQLEAAEHDEPLKRTLDRLGAAIVPADAMGDRLLNVNTPADLKVCERLLDQRASIAGAWNAHAEDWIRWARDERVDPFFWRFNLPAFLALLPTPGRLTIDLGCGEGRLSRQLQQLGHTVVGVDSSPRLAEAARSADPPTQVLVADASEVPLDDAIADLVVASMSLMNIADLDAAVREVARLLEPGGRFCFSIVHPHKAFGESGAETYFTETPYEITIEREGAAMDFHEIHRPLSALTGALEKAGLLVEALREPVPDAGLPDLAKYRRSPLFLHGRAMKPNVA
jgi:molybdopterin-guanine dinucleotide biosynthesis protein A/SAM-dependent methyltransferase